MSSNSKNAGPGRSSQPQSVTPYPNVNSEPNPAVKAPQRSEDPKSSNNVNLKPGNNGVKQPPTIQIHLDPSSPEEMPGQICELPTSPTPLMGAVKKTNRSSEAPKGRLPVQQTLSPGTVKEKSDLKGSIAHSLNELAAGIVTVFRGPSVYDFIHEERFQVNKTSESLDPEVETSIRALYLLLDDDGTGTLNDAELKDLNLLKADQKEERKSRLHLFSRKKRALDSTDIEELKRNIQSHLNTATAGDPKSITFPKFRDAIVKHLKSLDANKDKDKRRQFLDALDDWKSNPMKFDLNVNLLFLIIAVQLILFAPLAYSSTPDIGHVMAAGIAAALLFTGVFWGPVSFLKKTRQAVSRLYSANALAAVMSLLGFLTAGVTIYYFYYVFGANPMDRILGEALFPWAVNLLCLAGIASWKRGTARGARGETRHVSTHRSF